MSAEHFPTNGGKKGTTTGIRQVAAATSKNTPAMPNSAAQVPVTTTIRIALVRARKSGWLSGMITGFRRFLYIAAVVAIWIGLCRFELIEAPLRNAGTLCISAVLFFFAMPCSIFLRMDQLLSDWSPSVRPDILLLVALPMVLLNFLLFGAVRGALRRK